MSPKNAPTPGNRSVAHTTQESPASMRVAQSLLDIVSAIPSSKERLHQDPDDRAGEIVRAAKTKAALMSGGLALPPGPLGWVTILPEIYGVWKIQAQMVSDLAALHGRKSQLTREQMLYCLFRHTGAQLFRDLVMRVGERYIVRRLPIRSLYSVANKIGIRITQRSIGRAVSRFVPIAGAVGVGAYSWYDTRQVAKTAAPRNGPALDSPLVHSRQELRCPPAMRSAAAASCACTSTASRFGSRSATASRASAEPAARSATRRVSGANAPGSKARVRSTGARVTADDRSRSISARIAARRCSTTSKDSTTWLRYRSAVSRILRSLRRAFRSTARAGMHGSVCPTGSNTRIDPRASRAVGTR
jgi:hypothetical protein